MSFKEITSYILAILFLEYCTGCATQPSSPTPNNHPTKEIIYKARYIWNPEYNRRIEVFDLENLFVDSGNVDYLKTRNNKFLDDYGGGEIKICSNKEFLCLKAATLSVSIPKKLDEQNSMEWQFADLRCQATQASYNERIEIISCNDNQRLYWVGYNSSKGIVFYTGSREPMVTYELASERGLFAR